MIMTSMKQLKCEQSLVQKSAETFQHDLNLQCTCSCAAKEPEITRNRGKLSFCREQLRHANAATATALERLETQELWDMVDILHHSSISMSKMCKFGIRGLSTVPIYHCHNTPVSHQRSLSCMGGKHDQAPVTGSKHSAVLVMVTFSSWCHMKCTKINRPKSGFVLRSESPSKPPQTSKSQVQNGPDWLNWLKLNIISCEISLRAVSTCWTPYLSEISRFHSFFQLPCFENPHEQETCDGCHSSPIASQGK